MFGIADKSFLPKEAQARPLKDVFQRTTVLASDAHRFLVVTLDLVRSGIVIEKRAAVGIRQLSRNALTRSENQTKEQVSIRVEQIYRVSWKY